MDRSLLLKFKGRTKERKLLQVMGGHYRSNLKEKLMIRNGVSARVAIFFFILLTGAFVYIRWVDVFIAGGSSKTNFLPCSDTSSGITNCSFPFPPYHQVTTETSASLAEACPEYFKWIHEDLRPWKDIGITKEMVDSAEKLAHIRIVVVKGRVYLKKLKQVYQTRDVLTLWGIMQLLKLYPGKLPDLDIVFECGDRPVVKKRDFQGSEVAKIPPLFHYCGSGSTFDVAFPDWSFWGWPEVQISQWETLGKELQEGNNQVKWKDREPYAYWKGNSRVGMVRKDLLKCNVSKKQDWGALLYELNWKRELGGDSKTTDLASQCTHRYKIYAEGAAWSVSEKYILACDSVSLIITPQYHDFFTRSLIPTIHYWPVNKNHMCRSIKFAVDWGNNNTLEAHQIGKAGSKFILEELTMKHVYDYMFHLLNVYGNLLKYQPTVPEGAVEVCLETLARSDTGLKKLMINSMVKGPADSIPCMMPQAYDSATLQAFLGRNAKLTKQVEMREASELKKSKPNKASRHVGSK